MPVAEFVAQSSRDASSIASNPARLVNLYADKVGPGGRSEYVLRAVLGTEAYADPGELFLREIYEFDGVLFVVAGDKLFVVADGISTEIGTVTEGDDVSISRNAEIVTITSGGKYYTYDGVTLAEPTPGQFEDFGSVGFLAGRTVLSERNGAQWCWSDIADPDGLTALNFATAEQRPDNIVRLMVVAGTVMLLGERSTEVWAPSGAGVNAFALLPGAVIDTGLKAFGLVTQVDGALFLIGDDNIAYIAAGTTWQAVSSSAVNSAIKDGSPTRCFYYEDRGHKFCGIAFSDRPAWIYDIATGLWHERASGTEFGAWPVVASAKLGQEWVVGAAGKLFKLVDTKADADDVLCRDAISLPIYTEDYTTLAELEFFLSQGFAAGSGMVAVSPNGVQWPAFRTVSLAVGDFRNRLICRSMGRRRSHIVRIRITDPVDWPLWSSARVRLA